MQTVAASNHCPLLSAKGLSRVGLPVSSLFLAISASLIFNTGANAIETVTLVFNESRVSVPFDDFQTFVKTGETQRTNLQEFLAKAPNATRAARNVLTQEIAITRPFSERNFRNAIADFVLLQLNRVLTPVGAPENLEPLRTALVASYQDDQRISMLEIISNYPVPEITVQLPRVERAYNRVNAFIERVQPALETAKQFLQAIVCDCPSTTTSSEVDSPSQAAKANAGSSTKTTQCP